MPDGLTDEPTDGQKDSMIVHDQTKEIKQKTYRDIKLSRLVMFWNQNTSKLVRFWYGPHQAATFFVQAVPILVQAQKKGEI